MRRKVSKVTFLTFLMTFLLFGFTQAQEPQANKPDTTVSNYWKMSFLNRASQRTWEMSNDSLKVEQDTLPKLGAWRWAEDSWVTDDKTTHLVIFGLFHLFAMGCDATPGEAITLTTSLALGWEVKDALVPWERYGSIGGDGFSYKDFVWSVTFPFFVYLISKGET